jgi:hypothetical protein
MTKRPSSKPRESQRALVSDAALIEEALAEVIERASRVPDAARARELIARARTYQAAVGAWASCPPKATQRDALMEITMELRDRARHETQTLPPPPEASDRVASRTDVTSSPQRDRTDDQLGGGVAAPTETSSIEKTSFRAAARRHSLTLRCNVRS